MKSTMRAAVAVAATFALAVGFSPSAQARPAWDTSRVKVDREVRPQPRVVDLRVAEHQNFDRVVIDLQGKLPGYDVRYVRQLGYDGTGNPVPLNGRRFLAVFIRPAKAHDAQGDNVYVGPQLQQFSLPTLRGVAFTGDFEGQVSFGISLRSKADFRVTTLKHPQRIVIDLRH